VLGIKSIYAWLAHKAVQYCSRQSDRVPHLAMDSLLQLARSGLQLAIASQDIPAGISDAEAVRGQSGTAPNEIAPSHSLGVVAKPGGGRAAWSQSVQIDGCRGRGRKAEQENPRQHLRRSISSRHLKATHLDSNGSNMVT
jgi:hypothetical protein